MTYPIEQPDTAALLDARYLLHERVGEGGMAEVYRAEDVVLGRTVAIKLLKDDAQVLASPVRAHREVSALAQLNHPSLVTLLEASLSSEGPRYLVMEYVDGPTLAQSLRSGPLSTPHVALLAGELASGLAAVHAAGLVHRDVKPPNILLAPSQRPEVPFRVKLADFGLAQLADAPSVTTPGMVLGTAAYLAPEQVRGEPSGAASDVYALGLVLLEAFTGERAFSHASGIGAVMARLMESPAIPDHVDPHWADLLRRMTRSDPAERPTAGDVVDAVTSLPTGTGAPQVTAVLPRPKLPDTAPVPVRSLAQRHPAAGHRHRPRAARPPAWVGAGVAASAVVLALACLPGLTGGSSTVDPVAPVSVERPAEAPNDELPAVEPPTVEVTVDTSPADEAQAPAPAPAPHDDAPALPVDPKADPIADPKADKQDAASQREPEKQDAAEQRAADKAAQDTAREEKKRK